ncbi:hypothetical protein [Streptomyces sp. NBC_01768]|uniref:hypothetical protein n=1 Tax=Streptomyces sp. NBC_01768 TaxID=2975938 RepID=UPI002DD97230|nr:hypothetical protein [Streptomyces sp. NBC_01768]WSC31820.1 hypothetical protein OG902_36805 [Streptomyces sp. NBC_01768]
MNDFTTSETITSEALLRLRDQHIRLFEYADGMKNSLVGRGWTSERAEYVACTWLAETIQRTIRKGSK